MRDLHILVTGGAGFIGSHLVEAFLERGHAVRVLDNFSTGSGDNLDPFRAAIELVEGDIRDLEAVQQAVEGIDIVFHQAALPSVPRSIADPVTTHDVNATGTLHVLDASRRAGVRRVVYASSSSIYGDTPQLPKEEGMRPNPMSPYAVSKLAGETYCRVFSEVYGLETIALRYFNVFGRRQDPDSAYSAVIPKFVKRMLRGEQPVIYGDGEQTRDFTYVANVVQANMLAATAHCNGGLVLNCACHSRTTVNALVHTLNGVLGTNLDPHYEAPRPGDVLHSFADITLAEQHLKYRPKVGLQEGLRLTVQDYIEVS